MGGDMNLAGGRGRGQRKETYSAGTAILLTLSHLRPIRVFPPPVTVVTAEPCGRRLVTSGRINRHRMARHLLLARHQLLLKHD